MVYYVNSNNKIERGILERKPFCVGNLELDVRKLILSDADHLFREINTDDVCATLDIPRGEDARTASDVENLFAGL